VRRKGRRIKGRQACYALGAAQVEPRERAGCQERGDLEAEIPYFKKGEQIQDLFALTH
jgi:hypothetical protein